MKVTPSQISFVHILLAVFLACIAFTLPGETLSPAGKYALAILVLAAILWVTEAVPLFITSLVVLLLEAILIPYAAPDTFVAADFFAPFFSPVIVLFLGGLTIAHALQKKGLDRRIANYALELSGGKLWKLLGVFMTLTAVLSMWMSNTAVTALMLGVAAPVMTSLGKKSLRTGIVLATAFSANIGGMVTPVGSPPNAIAIGLLAENGIHISFIEWMSVAAPIAVILLVLTYLFVTFRYAFQGDIETPKTESLEAFKWYSEDGAIVGIVAVTIVMWLCSGWIGLSSGIIALIPIVVLYGARILRSDDLKFIDWEILLIIGGGLSLSVALARTGVIPWIVQITSLDMLSSVLVVLGFVSLTFVMTNVVSNTTTAALIMPLALVVFPDPVTAAFVIGLTASVSMLLPISTPPNTIAYKTGHLPSSHMLHAGTIIGMCALIAITIFV